MALRDDLGVVEHELVLRELVEGLPQWFSGSSLWVLYSGHTSRVTCAVSFHSSGRSAYRITCIPELSRLSDN